MESSPRKPPSAANMPIDEMLSKAGYQRKSSPRDPTCLFRAFAEQIYLSQRYHIRVREECVRYMKKHSHVFKQRIKASYETYLEEMSYFTEYGGPNEIAAMSLLYEREVFLFDGMRMTAQKVTNNGFEETLYLCLTLPRHYESVFPKGTLANIGFCQSIVYQTLYRDVFKMNNLEETVQHMLYDNPGNLRHDRFFQSGNLAAREQLTNELLSKYEKKNGTTERAADKAKALPKPPFPYKVAKALDPNIYRNIDLDVWIELKREVRNAGWSRWSSMELQVGGKCLVQLEGESESPEDRTNNNLGSRVSGRDREVSTSGRGKLRVYYGHIQQMSKNEGPVVVFIEELGEKRTLPYSALKPLPPLSVMHRDGTGHAGRSSEKWKKTWKNFESRKSRDVHGKDRVDSNNNSNGNLVCKMETRKMDGDAMRDRSKEDSMENMKNRMIEKYTSYQSFSIQNTIDVRPVMVVYDKPGVQSQEEAGNRPELGNNQIVAGEEPARASPSVGSLPPEAIIQPLQQVSLNCTSEPFFPQPGGPPCGNIYPCVLGEPPDRALRGVNLSVSPSLEMNGSDLPYSDPVTLRFFYNLGLQYFRSGTMLGFAQPENPPIQAAQPSLEEAGQPPQGNPGNEANAWPRKQKPGPRNVKNEQSVGKFTGKGNRRNEARQGFECPGRNERRWPPSVEPQRFPNYDRAKEQFPRKNFQSIKNNRAFPRNRNPHESGQPEAASQPRSREFRQIDKPNFSQELKGHCPENTGEVAIPPPAPLQPMQTAYAVRQVNGLTLFYPCDSNGYYPPFTGCYPMPYATSPEVMEPNQGMNQAPPGAVFPIVNENYARPIPSPYPSYVIPQMFPGGPGPQEWPISNQMPFPPQESNQAPSP